VEDIEPVKVFCPRKRKKSCSTAMPAIFVPQPGEKVDPILTAPRREGALRVARDDTLPPLRAQGRKPEL
jgi:hypothetical protein